MDYKKSKIYKIWNEIDDEIYIGSTCQRLAQRMTKHRSSAKCNENKKNYRLYEKMRELGNDKFHIELIVECPCDNKEQLHSIEGGYIREYGSLNMLVAGRTSKQYHKDNVDYLHEQKKIYYLENQEYIKEKSREYRRNNRDKKIEQDKAYYEKVKDKLKEKMVCPTCGVEISKGWYLQHSRTKKHIELTKNI